MKRSWTASTFHVGNVALKLPPFMEDDPEAWFGLIEAQFELRGITTDSTKFYHAVSGLQGNPQKQVKDILKLPRSITDRYSRLKERLTESYGMNKIDRAAQIMTWPIMDNDEKPVYINGLLSMMADIPTDHVFFRATILGKLPPQLTDSEGH